MKYLSIDKSRFPIVVLKFNEMTPTMEEFEEHQREHRKLLEENHDFIIYWDFTHMKFLSSDFRINQGRFMKTIKDLEKERLLGTVMYTPSVVGILMLKGLHVIVKPNTDYKVVRSFDEGLDWANKKIAEHELVNKS